MRLQCASSSAASSAFYRIELGSNRALAASFFQVEKIWPRDDIGSTWIQLIAHLEKTCFTFGTRRRCVCEKFVVKRVDLSRRPLCEERCAHPVLELRIVELTGFLRKFCLIDSEKCKDLLIERAIIVVFAKRARIEGAGFISGSREHHNASHLLLRTARVRFGKVHIEQISPEKISA